MFVKFGRRIREKPPGMYIKSADFTEKLCHLNEQDGRRLLIARLVEFRTGCSFLMTGLRVRELLSGERENFAVIVEVLQAYLVQMEKFYEDMVPDHLKKTMKSMKMGSS